MKPDDIELIVSALNKTLSRQQNVVWQDQVADGDPSVIPSLVTRHPLTSRDVTITGSREVCLARYLADMADQEVREITDTLVRDPSGWRVVHRHLGTSRALDPRESSITYGDYLDLDNLLACQIPLTESHDELLFIIIHQVYELWFRQILHEGSLLQALLEEADAPGALHTARRIAKILKTIVGQLDVLETLTPQQFETFRPNLGSASGFQSAQFRYLEALLGRRDFPETIVAQDPVLLRYISERPLFSSLLFYLAATGYPIPDEVLYRDPAIPWQSQDVVTESLLRVYREDSHEPVEVCEALLDIDEGLQEWRYRHIMMVERIIGTRQGTGGSTGADYLRSTLFRPAFPDLWHIRGAY
jgi:tryptophan 2,3-dioxygenase